MLKLRFIIEQLNSNLEVTLTTFFSRIDAFRFATLSLKELHLIQYNILRKRLKRQGVVCVFKKQ